MNQQITVGTCTEILEASMIQMELDAAGIDCDLDNEFTVGVDPLLANAVGGIKIKVSPACVEAATEVLEKYYENKASERAAKAKICPQCKNKDGQPIHKPNWVGILSVLTLGAFTMLYAWPKFSCPDCRNTWS